MKFLIWLVSIIIASLCKTLLSYAGVSGALVALLVYGVMIAVARALCVAYDERRACNGARRARKGEQGESSLQKAVELKNQTEVSPTVPEENKPSTEADLPSPLLNDEARSEESSPELSESVVSTTEIPENPADHITLNQTVPEKIRVKVKRVTPGQPVSAVPKEAESSNNPEKGEPPQSEQASLAESKVKFCRRCGFELLEGSVFCSKCGLNVTET